MPHVSRKYGCSDLCKPHHGLPCADIATKSISTYHCDHTKRFARTTLPLLVPGAGGGAAAASLSPDVHDGDANRDANARVALMVTGLLLPVATTTLHTNIPSPTPVRCTSGMASMRYLAYTRY